MNLLPDYGTLFLPYRGAAPAGVQPLRVGVALDGRRPPQWVDALLAFLKQIPNLEIVRFALAAESKTEPKRPSWLTDRLYTASLARFDPLKIVEDGQPNSAAAGSVDALRTAGCDVVIWLAHSGPDIEFAGLARHGVFTVRLGEGNRTIPFWDEVAGSRVTSTATIFWHDSSFSSGRVVRKPETSTSQGLYVTENLEQPLVALIRGFAGLCMEVQHGPSQFEERARKITAQRTGESTRPDDPSSFEAGSFAFKKLTRSAFLRWKGVQKREWFVAIRPNAGKSVTDPAQMDLTGFKEIPMPKGVDFMADPFPWEDGGKQYLLFEEFPAGHSHGRNSFVELRPDGSCSELAIILEKPYNVSYPCIVRSGGDLFMVPETAEAKRVDLYRFRRFPAEVELVSTPLEGAALVDTTPIFVDGRWYFFTTTVVPFHEKAYMETVLFSGTRLEGPWELHPCNPVSTSVRSSRSAGHLFWRDGRLFRPTQDCSVRYGYAIAINEVTKLTPDEFEERPAGYIPPSWMPALLGTHTWNENSAFQVIDGIRYTK